MKEYFRFEVERFIRESKSWDETLQRLALELDSIPEISAMSGNPGKSSEVSNPTERIAINRHRVQVKIDKIRAKKDAFQFAWDRITPAEKELITGFFFGEPGSIPAYIDKWCAKHSSNRKYCYQHRREALDEFSRYVVGYFRSKGY